MTEEINLTDEYKTRSGHPVTVYATNLRGKYPVLAVVHNTTGDKDLEIRCTKEGLFYCEKITEYDLIKVSPYAHIKIDDKVLVGGAPEFKNKRHFAGISDKGFPMTWEFGKTSWTGSYDTETWSYCELYTE